MHACTYLGRYDLAQEEDKWNGDVWIFEVDIGLGVVLKVTVVPPET